MAKPLPRMRQALEQQADRRKLDKLLRETEDTASTPTGGTNGGDWVRLRGLPIVGPGVSGTVIGTDPLGALLAKERRRGRAH